MHSNGNPNRRTPGASAIVLALLLTPALAPAQPAPKANPAADLPRFEVASVRQTPNASFGFTSVSPYGTGQFSATNITLEALIELAFGVTPDQISGEPDWLGSEHYDVAAKAPAEVRLSYELLKPRMQRLLQERFGLATHRGTKYSEGFALVVAKGGPKLHPHTPAATAEASVPNEIRLNGIRVQDVPMSSLAAVLARPLGKPVVDQTGIQGNYDFQLDYAPDGASDTALPSIFTALREQLGLRLEKHKVPVEILVIDHIEKVPTAN
jgi:uncharacterized protein (TIGR03435 family)